MKAAFGAMQTRLLQMLWLDPDETAYAANITVWLRWLFWVGAVIELAYRPAFTQAKYIPFMLMHVPLVALNGYVHYRLLSRRRVTWRHLLLLSAMDIALITASVVVDGGFDNFLYIPYYPALAAFAAVFTSALLNLTWTTITASIYVGVSLTVGSGGPGRRGRSGSPAVRVGGRVPWGAKAEYAYRAGYDGMGRLSMTPVLMPGYSAMLKQPEMAAA